MIVYGGQTIDVTLQELVRGIKRRLSRPDSLDEARIRLVLAGQLEQAVEDAGLECTAQCRTLTTIAATHFYDLLCRRESEPRWTQQMCEQLESIDFYASSGARLVSIKTPEGFAWYGLYPDAYAQAAERWARCLAPGTRVLVIGIRSIGTTLAATVAAAFRSCGLDVQCLTVRPEGHPFRRRISLPPDAPIADRAVIVDEGPGLSGSSMVSVAEALTACGFASNALTFFPGHKNGPGAEACPEVRRWWAQIPCRHVSWDDLRFGDRPAGAALAELAQALLGTPVEALRDVGGGKWREVTGPPEPQHAVAPFLEQPKLLASAGTGAGVLFKFAGFALAPIQDLGSLRTTAEAQAAKLERLAHAGLTAKPLAVVHGWLALPWVSGRRMRVSDANPSQIDRIGSYIRASAGAPLSEAESERAFGRLREVLVRNSLALLGEEAERSAEDGSDRLADQLTRLALPAYGDGRLAPHEWVQAGPTVLKMDAAGHDHDHTAIGPQAVWWDVAGASIEWNLDETGRDKLACAVGLSGHAHGAYFRAAYAAFRGAIAKLGLQSASPGDRLHFQRARDYYSNHLRRELRLLGSVGA